MQVLTLLPFARVAQLVELLICNQGVAGSSPVACSFAPVVQLVERIRGKDEVAGSTPVGCSHIVLVLEVCFKYPRDL